MIYALGLDWEIAPLETRERFSLAQQDAAALRQSIAARPGVGGCVLLQTCNRFELYLDADETIDLKTIEGLLPGAVECAAAAESPLFRLAGRAAEQRLMEIACGLRSQILGEEQILTQVRAAAEAARAGGTASPVLETLFRLAVTAGKAVRTAVRFHQVPASCAHKAVELAGKALGPLAGKRALVIGNGEMGRLTAGLLAQAGCRVTVTLRSYRHGETLVPAGCQTVPYADRQAAMAGCDLLVSATKSPHYTVTAPMLAAHAQRPRVVVDMALPRDIDPACRDIQNLAFYDMDDLGDAGPRQGGPEMAQALAIIQKHLADYETWRQNRLARSGIPATGRLAVFAGTSEGRALCVHLAATGVPASVFVATEYGRALLPELPGLTVHSGRLDAAAMALALAGHDRVVDATHPYAAEASRNIRAAAGQAGAQYLRLVRPATETPDGVLCVPDTAAAVARLAGTRGPVLLTTGSKELAAYTALPGFAERVYARVLPDAGVLRHCLDLGLPAAHLIAMQGPFSHDLNLALLRSTGARWLVTKDTGSAGGLLQKLSAAEEAGVKVLLVSRPQEPAGGHTLEELCRLLAGCAPAQEQGETSRFPLFVSLAGRPCLVVGAGRVGIRRCAALAAFGADVTLVSPRFQERPEGVRLLERPYQAGDTKGMALVVAATDSRAVNRAVALECRQNGIPVSVADCPEECSFYFPALCLSPRLTAGLVSVGGHHALVARSAAAIRSTLEELDI